MPRGCELASVCRYLAFHARGGNHCHLNFIGVSKNSAAKAQQAFQAAAKQAGFSLDTLPGQTAAERQQALQDAVGQGQYFQAFLPDGGRLVHAIPRCDCQRCAQPCMQRNR